MDEEGEALEPGRFTLAVDVMPKEGISDPQGQTIERALPSLGFADVHDVRVGKRIELVVEAPDAGTAEAIVRAACVRFLANPVIEDFRVTLAGARAGSAAGTDENGTDENGTDENGAGE